ncbi:hypothetical protein J4423_03050 [Candidatus Pacearchaeota archaeon]|nr:hypothetical protein [Candidatus Pacearchaeota archaeon]
MVMADIVGWLGAFLLLLAYFLLVHKNLTSMSKMYQWLNIIGALLLAINNIYLSAYPSFVTNAIWFLIGLYGIFHIVKHNRKKSKAKRNVP